MVRILCVGDVVGDSGRAFLTDRLRGIIRSAAIDMCIVNGENSARGNGITPDSAAEIFEAGADVITTGNHVWQRREIYDCLDENRYILRPYNYYTASPGRGFAVFEKNGLRIMVGNLAGTVYLDGASNAFLAADRMLSEAGEADIRIIDFHAEATSEKIALGLYLDGRVSAVFGTHTHVQTADEQILPGGTGYITDLGMTGGTLSVLGLDPRSVIKKFVTGMPQRFEASCNPVRMCAAVFDIDEKSGRTVAVERLTAGG